MGTVNACGTPILFGQVGAFLSWDVCAALAALFVIVGVGLWIIWRWRTGFAEEAPVSIDQQLDRYREMVAQGELDPEEFERIKAQLQNPPPPADDKTPKDDQPPDTSIRAM